MRHEPFVKGLARSLSRDESSARDLEQDTWLAALRHPPRDRHGLRPWLARVLRNQAISRSQRDQRRLDQELYVAHSSSTADGDDAALVRSVRRALHEEVRRLKPHYRAVLQLRYFDGLALERIAEELRLPIETVRTRLRRATQQLRGRLARGGGRGDWLGGLVALSGRPSEVERVGRTGRVLRAAGLSGAAAAIVWIGAARSTEPEEDREPSPAAERVAVALEPPAPSEPRSAAAGAPEPGTHAGAVEVLVREGAAPVAGFEVALELLGPHDAPRLRSRTDGQGRAVLADLAPGRWSLSPARGRGRSLQVQAGATTRIDLDLPPGLTVEGVVHDAGGRPVEGASLFTTFADAPHEWIELGRTDGGGHFRVSGVDPDGWLHAGRSDLGASFGRWLGALEVAAGSAWCELDMGADTRSFSGRVLDPDGKPIAGSRVSLRPYVTVPLLGEKGHLVRPVGVGAVLCDETGAFEFPAVYPERYLLEARAPGFEAQSPLVWLRRKEWPRPTVELVPEPTAEEALAERIGRVVDASGAPMAGLRVRRVAPNRARALSALERIFEPPSESVTYTDAAGIFRFASDPTRVRSLIVWSEVEGRPVAIAANHGGTEDLLMTDGERCSPAASVSGTVESALPVRLWLVSRLLETPLEARPDPITGAFRFERLAPGSYDLFAWFPGRQPWVLSPPRAPIVGDVDLGAFEFGVPTSLRLELAEGPGFEQVTFAELIPARAASRVYPTVQGRAEFDGGVARFDDVFPGAYVVRLDGPDLIAFEQRIEVPEDAARVALELPELIPLTFELVRAPGAGATEIDLGVRDGSRRVLMDVQIRALRDTWSHEYLVPVGAPLEVWSFSQGEAQSEVLDRSRIESRLPVRFRFGVAGER